MPNEEVDQQYALGAGICGMFILLCGVGDLTIGIVWVTTFSPHGFPSHGSGFWSGILLVIAGVLGIAVRRDRNKGLMIGFLVMSIIGCIVTSIQALVSGNAHAVWVLYSNTRCHSFGSGCTCTNNQGQSKYISDSKACDLITPVVGSLLAFIILSAFGAIFTLAGSIIGCMVACGSSPQSSVISHQSTQGTVVVTQTHQARVYPQQNSTRQYPLATGHPQAAAPPKYTDK